MLCRSCLVSMHTPIAWKRKVDTTWTFVYSEKGVKWCQNFILQLMEVFVCWVIWSHGNRRPHFMNSECIDDLKGAVVPKLTINIFASTPTTLATKLIHLDKKSNSLSWSTKSGFWTNCFLPTSTTYECCQGSWGHCELHKKDSPSDSRAIVWISSPLSIMASWPRLTAPTQAKSSLGWTSPWSKFFKRQFLHSSASFTAKQTRAQTSDAIGNHGSICTHWDISH